MKGSSKTLSRMLRTVVLLLLVALITSPGQSRQLGNEHPQTDPRVVVDGEPKLPPRFRGPGGNMSISGMVGLRDNAQQLHLQGIYSGNRTALPPH